MGARPACWPCAPPVVVAAPRAPGKLALEVRLASRPRTPSWLARVVPRCTVPLGRLSEPRLPLNELLLRVEGVDAADELLRVEGVLRLTDELLRLLLDELLPTELRLLLDELLRLPELNEPPLDERLELTELWLPPPPPERLPPPRCASAGLAPSAKSAIAMTIALLLFISLLLSFWLFLFCCKSTHKL